jgi:hypothetical protein
MSPPLIVWKRASFNRIIGLQCSLCERRFELTGGFVTDIEDGKVVTPRCPNLQCGAIIDVDLSGLGGYLWMPPPHRTAD